MCSLPPRFYLTKKAAPFACFSMYHTIGNSGANARLDQERPLEAPASHSWSGFLIAIPIY